MTANEERFVVRLPFWPTWLRMAVAFQLLLLIVTICCIAFRGVVGTTLLGWDDVVGLSTGHAGAAIGCLGLAWMTRWYSGAVLTAAGIRPYYPTGERKRLFRWNEVLTIRRHAHWLRGRWIWLYPVNGRPFNLPEHPIDSVGFRDAVERFAGPAHPLAVALGEVAEGA